MSEATFYPSGEVSAKNNEKSFTQEVVAAFKEVDKDFTRETGITSRAKKLLINTGLVAAGAMLYTTGMAIGGDAGAAAAILGAPLALAGTTFALYHTTQTKLAKGFVAAAKSFDETTGLSKDVKSFVGAAKRHIVEATRKEPTFEINGQVMSEDKRSMPRRIFDYMRAKRTK